jgi:hypothetical protein
MSTERIEEEAMAKASAPRLVLHASMTNMYWVIIAACVTTLVALPTGLVRMWREQPRQDILIFGVVVTLVLVLVIAYCQRKARWLVADARGLTITERTRSRLVPWASVRSLMDLGYLGSAPGARRYHVDFADGEFFTFLADPDAMARLEKLRDRWGITAAR